MRLSCNHTVAAALWELDSRSAGQVSEFINHIIVVCFLLMS